MLKYLNTAVTFAEIPDEITLCINITGCPMKCPECHSKFLWTDSGEPLTSGTLDIIIPKNKGISCVCFMGGDSDPLAINSLAKHIKHLYPELSIAWYSGRIEIPEEIDSSNFDYIKLGPYIEKYGGLNDPETNQKLFKILHKGERSCMENITYKLWKK